MRHQNGFGSIVKLGGKRRKPYAVRITTGWKDGKQIRKYLGFYKTEREALIALADYHKTGYDIDLSKLTLAETYERWIKRIESKIDSTAMTRHKMTYVRFGRLADVPIVNIKADQLQDWMDNITDLSSGSKIQIKSTLSQVWKYAIKNDIVSSNYAEHIEIERDTARKGSTFTIEEIKKLWDNSDNRIVQWWLIMIYTGMRIGELYQMTTENIHLDEQYMVGGLKTKAGTNRVIPIHNAILPLIKEQMKDSKYLMHIGSGKRYSYGKIRLMVKELMEEYKWEHLPHDARKTAVSLMHSAGVPIETIRVIVGHSGKGVTEKVYLYKTPSELVEMVNRVKIDTQPIDTEVEISD
jgi:integrase